MRNESSTGRISNLPTALTPFVGREREIQAMSKLIGREEVRLLTVTGAGGVGKTRLVIEVARRLQYGDLRDVVFVDLSLVGDSDAVLYAIGQALSVEETGNVPIFDRLVAQLRETSLLLILDNFEHVLQAAAPVAHLLRSCPLLKALVASRALLRVSGERWSYPGLVDR
jgi:predicted ATPase